MLRPQPHFETASSVRDGIKPQRSSTVIAQQVANRFHIDGCLFAFVRPGPERNDNSENGLIGAEGNCMFSTKTSTSDCDGSVYPELGTVR